MRQSWSWNYVWAGLCLLGAVFFIFRDPGKATTKPVPSSCVAPGATGESEQ
jgi:hypothetical protein